MSSQTGPSIEVLMENLALSTSQLNEVTSTINTVKQDSSRRIAEVDQTLRDLTAEIERFKKRIAELEEEKIKREGQDVEMK